MLEKNLSEQILSIGNRSDRPDGGISQVLYSNDNCNVVFI